MNLAKYTWWSRLGCSVWDGILLSPSNVWGTPCREVTCMYDKIICGSCREYQFHTLQVYMIPDHQLRGPLKSTIAKQFHLVHMFMSKNNTHVLQLYLNWCCNCRILKRQSRDIKALVICLALHHRNLFVLDTPKYDGRQSGGAICLALEQIAKCDEGWENDVFHNPRLCPGIRGPSKRQLVVSKRNWRVMTHRSTMQDWTYDPFTTVTVGENITSRVFATITSFAAAASDSLAQMHWNGNWTPPSSAIMPCTLQSRASATCSKVFTRYTVAVCTWWGNTHHNNGVQILIQVIAVKLANVLASILCSFFDGSFGQHGLP